METSLIECATRWKASLSASALYAADAILRGRAAAGDPLVEPLRESAHALGREIGAAGLPEARFWQHLLPLAAGIESNRQLAETALAKTLGVHPRAQALAGPLAGRIADCERAALQAAPDLVDALAARAQPLHAEWNARGDALLATVARLTDARLVPPGAEVVAVWPATGGPGTACLDYNLVLLEAPEAEAVPAMAPAVRVVWLLAQLNQDLPVFSEGLPRGRLALLAAAATLPPTLAAAEEMGLHRCDHATIEAALGTVPWPVASKTLLSWWDTYLSGRPPWHVALAALDRMGERPYGHRIGGACPVFSHSACIRSNSGK